MSCYLGTFKKTYIFSKAAEKEGKPPYLPFPGLRYSLGAGFSEDLELFLGSNRYGEKWRFSFRTLAMRIAFSWAYQKDEKTENGYWIEALGLVRNEFIRISLKIKCRYHIWSLYYLKITRELFNAHLSVFKYYFYSLNPFQTTVFACAHTQFF